MGIRLLTLKVNGVGIRMEIINMEYDQDLPFARGLTTLHTLMERSSYATYTGIVGLCSALKDEYLWDIELIPFNAHRFTLYFSVPEHYSEVKIGWLFEILKYYTCIGVDIKIVKCNEPADVIKDYLGLKYNIETEMHNALTNVKGKIPCTDKGVTYLSEVLKSAISNLTGESIITHTAKDNIKVEVTLPSRTRELQIKGIIEY